MNRILIIEDEPRIVAFLEKGLRSQGFITIVAQDGCEAWHLSTREVFDLILLDLALPDKHGLDVLRDLHSAGNQQPVFILTVYDDPRYRELGFQYGASDYLIKPFKFNDLLDRIQSLLQVD